MRESIEAQSRPLLLPSPFSFPHHHYTMSRDRLRDIRVSHTLTTHRSSTAHSLAQPTRHCATNNTASFVPSSRPTNSLRELPSSSSTTTTSTRTFHPAHSSPALLTTLVILFCFLVSHSDQQGAYAQPAQNAYAQPQQQYQQQYAPPAGPPADAYAMQNMGRTGDMPGFFAEVSTGRGG